MLCFLSTTYRTGSKTSHAHFHAFFKTVTEKCSCSTTPKNVKEFESCIWAHTFTSKSLVAEKKWILRIPWTGGLLYFHQLFVDHIVRSHYEIFNLFLLRLAGKSLADLYLYNMTNTLVYNCRTHSDWRMIEWFTRDTDVPVYLKSLNYVEMNEFIRLHSAVEYCWDSY